MNTNGTNGDPFEFGWRYLPVTRPNGTRGFKQAPLTMRDVLHPQEGDVVLENTWHERNRRYASSVANARVANRPKVVVLCDCGTDLDLPDVEPISPDLALFENVAEPKARYRVFDIRAEKADPAFFLEITSPRPNTRANDVETKYRLYHQAKIPIYVIVDDRWEAKGVIDVLGYRWARSGYQAMPLDELGRLWLESLQLWLGATEGRIAFWDKQGKELGDYTAVVNELEAEVKARQAAERQAARETKARAHAETKAAKSAARATKAVAQATKAVTKAKQETQARKAAEKRIRELEAQVRNLRGGS